MKNMKKLKIIIIFLVWVLAGTLLINKNISISSPLGTDNQKKLIQRENKYGKIEEIDKILDQYFFEPEKIDKQKQIDEATKAYVDSIDDPYTSYLDQEQSSWLEVSLKWENDFEGIGVYINKKEYYIQIEELIKNGPAFKAGLLPLDRIVQIDDTIVKDITIDEATKLLKWPSGSKVIVVVERIDKETHKDLLKIEIEREKINLLSVNTKIFNIWVNQNILYAEFLVIGEETENIFKQKLKEIDLKSIQWVIIDLRGNWWWLMSVAWEIMSHFIPKGDKLLSAKYKSFNDSIVYSEWYWDLENLPIIILIDGYSASASEIIALWLKEQLWATIIWTQSFGKGTIQTIDNFVDWDSIKYTIGKRYSPNDINIDKIGIKPDINIEFDIDNYILSSQDNQLEKAKETMKTRIQ